MFVLDGQIVHVSYKTVCQNVVCVVTWCYFNRIAIVPTKDPAHDKRYLAYITEDKVGLHILPLEGNPHDAMALIGHPAGVSNMVCSYDGKYIFTAGGSDATVHMWEINIK
jgi:WD40 repeat protein